jgi:NAD(P)-dependent dehydrogenase (short-subunit alcohol dehydrogenase family)
MRTLLDGVKELVRLAPYRGDVGPLRRDVYAGGRHFARQQTGGDIVLVSTKNVFAPGARFGAYSATKAAAHQLARIASLEMADLDVRVNMVSPDAVFSHGTRRSGLWAEVGPERMKARGLDEAGLEEYYRTRNLLKARVTARHVANAVLYFATRQSPSASSSSIGLPVRPRTESRISSSASRASVEMRSPTRSKSATLG